ncbi:hypothetical protein K2Z84_06710, partial [Candidatus Binatia bacterium]|nr:hypothetical protein [Candidatus Binatia bacterium]
MSQHVREAIRAENKRPIANRVSVIFALSAIFLVAAIPANRDLGPDVWHRLMLARVGGAVVQLVLAAALRASRDASWTRVVSLALASFAAGFATTLAVAVLTGDPWLLIFVLVLVLMMTYVIFPWGVAPHVVLTVLALACLAVVLDQLSVNLVVAILASFAISIYAAIVFDRQFMRAKAGELLREGHERVLELIAGDAEPDAVFAELLRILDQQAPELCAAVLLPDEGARRVRVAASAGLADAYVAALDGSPLDEDSAFGAVLRRGEPTFVAVLGDDPRMKHLHDAAHDTGVLSCWS